MTVVWHGDRKALVRVAGMSSARAVRTPLAPSRFALPRLFAADSPFNTPIPGGAAVHPNSANMLSNGIDAQPARVFVTHDDFAIPFAYTQPSDPLNTVAASLYGLDYDPGPFRFPADAAPATGSDKHLASIFAGQELDQWLAQRVDATHWTSGARYLFDLTGSGVAPADRVASTASNFALTAGVVRPEEIAAGVINHALVFTTSGTRNIFVPPATHGDGPSSSVDRLPIGARIQLDPSVNVAALAIPAWQRTIAVALQVYGAYCGDTSGVFTLRGEASIGRGSPDIWGPVGISNNSPNILAPFPWSSMRVLDWT